MPRDESPGCPDPAEKLPAKLLSRGIVMKFMVCTSGDWDEFE